MLIKESGFDFQNWVGKAKYKTAPVSDLMHNVSKISIGIGLSSLLISKVVDKINNDITRKRLIEDLALNDPQLKDVDKKTLMEWYATMYMYAPTLSKDKHTVAEVLRGFARFGKVDLQTLKLLTDTEKNIADANRSTTLGAEAISRLF